MDVKELWKKMRYGEKNLKISADLHTRLKVAAAKEGTALAVYAEALLEVGLQNREAAKRLLEADTSAGRRKPKP